MKQNKQNQESASHVIDRQPKASQQPEIAAILQRYIAGNLVIQCGGGGRGNHLYNDFLAHFQKHWIPRLQAILTRFRMPAPIGSLIAIFEKAEHLSEMREYTTRGEELFDGKDISGRSETDLGVNVLRYGSIMFYIDGLLDIMNQREIRDISIQDYDALMHALELLKDHISFFMVDTDMKHKVKDLEIIDLFKSLLNIVYQMLSQLRKPIHRNCMSGVTYTRKLMEDIASKKLPLEAILRESETSPLETTEHTPRVLTPARSGKVPFPEFDEMLASRRTMTDSLRALELQSAQRPTNRITVPGHAGVFKFDPDEISGDRNDCFFLTFRILTGMVSSITIRKLRSIAGLPYGRADHEHILALANQFNYTIHFLQFDLAFNPAPAVITVGTGSRHIYIAQIFGGHFTPMYRVG